MGPSTRQIAMIGHASRTSLAAAVALALGAQQAAGGQVIENRGQAMPKGAQRAVQASRVDRRAMKKEAAKELMDMSRKTLVVAHLHPRWLRDAVSEMMAAGARIDVAAVEHLRSQGPEAARMIVEAYLGQ